MQLCRAERNPDRGGLNIVLAGAEAAETSDVWTVAGWEMQFVRLQPDKTTPLDQSRGTIHIKVVTGTLRVPVLTPFASPKTIRSTVVDAEEVTAGPDGAVFAVLTATDAVADNIHSIDELVFDGPEAETFVWTSFYDRFGGAEVFDGVDAHIVPGFHLLDADHTEIAYVHFWATGKGADASTHDHSRAPSPTAPAFAEVHWAFNNGTGAGGMYECAEVGAPRTTHVMQRGEEHGPFWRVDPDTGMPNRRPNGAVEYGWHGWQAGTDETPGQAFDFVAAVEINPDYAPLVLSGG